MKMTGLLRNTRNSLEARHAFPEEIAHDRPLAGYEDDGTSEEHPELAGGTHCLIDDFQVGNGGIHRPGFFGHQHQSAGISSCHTRVAHQKLSLVNLLNHLVDQLALFGGVEILVEKLSRCHDCQISHFTSKLGQRLVLLPPDFVFGLVNHVA
jgi:hypothetical protein